MIEGTTIMIITLITMSVLILLIVGYLFVTGTKIGKKYKNRLMSKLTKKGISNNPKLHKALIKHHKKQEKSSIKKAVAGHHARKFHERHLRKLTRRR